MWLICIIMGHMIIQIRIIDILHQLKGGIRRGMYFALIVGNGRIPSNYLVGSMRIDDTNIDNLMGLIIIHTEIRSSPTFIIYPIMYPG